MVEMTPEQSPLNGDEWQRITQMHEVVKQEGDGRCEQAFDDLIRAHNVLLDALRAEWERAEQAERRVREHHLDPCESCAATESERAEARQRLHALEDGLEKWREAAERVRQIDEAPRRW